ncbi:hypothetical protein TNCV_950661 [Trichonephila clavipes]|nr:hypothetical protein TNCV_950661 [Trichonephila clavipes]
MSGFISDGSLLDFTQGADAGVFCDLFSFSHVGSNTVKVYSALKSFDCIVEEILESSLPNDLKVNGQVIELPAKCEKRSVISFLTVKNMSVADDHCQITEVFGTEAMRDCEIPKWARKFKDG